MEFYVIFFRNRCMGFQASEAHAREVAEILGPGSDVERCTGDFPTDEASAAREHNERRARGQNVHTLYVVEEPATVELTQAEIGELVESLGLGMDEDPWADEPTQTLITCPGPGESGFFKAEAG
jgi:hypothetical protein